MIHSNNCFPALSPQGYDKKKHVLSKNCTFTHQYHQPVICKIHFGGTALQLADQATLKVKTVIQQQQFFHHLYFIFKHCFAAGSFWDPLELE